MFFCNDMILICLLVYLVQRYDAKRVAICAQEVAEPAVWSEAGSIKVARRRSGVAAR